MNRTLCPIWLLISLFLNIPLFAQIDYATSPNDEQVHDNNTVNGYFYKLLFFSELPSTHDNQILERSGVRLMEYIPANTYIAAIPSELDPSYFEQFPLKSIQPLTADFKLSRQLKMENFPEWAIFRNNLHVIIKFHKNLTHEEVLKYCKIDSIEVLATNGVNNFLKVSFAKNRLEKIADLPYISQIDLIPEPGIADDQHGRAMHRSNVLNTSFPSGRHYDGFGVSVLCRDDGMVGPHIDFNGRIDNSQVKNPNSLGGKHGDGVCGIIGGAGNLNPRNEGMAPASTIYTIDYQADFLDETINLHLDKNVLVTNSSYSNGCNVGYTITAETVDQQLFDYPTLMHVFSAGNSNNLDCGYGAGNQWGNITGGHKQAKNCITVANLQYNGTISTTSSRGPAHDGRIKPDLAAFGDGQISTDHENGYQVFGGTSAAAPGITGTLAQLHQAYQTLNNGNIAEAALLKACLLNTANDLGNPGPDFKYGWGQVNALRAVQTLEQKQYLTSTISPGQTQSHIIPIPDGIIEARLMLYWHDPEASNAPIKALVNNLDLQVIDLEGNVHLPWLLNPNANPANLDAPAGKGIDNLNNMEQVLINNPQPGNYTIQVFGKEMPFGALPYFIVWEYRTREIVVTHPIGGEAFSPGDTLNIQWDATSNSGTFELSFSLDNGVSFINIATVSGSKRMYDWKVPANLLGLVKVRVRNIATGMSGMSPAAFSLAPKPKNVKVEKACPDFIKITWDGVDWGIANANPTYQILLLGTKDMEVIGTTTTLGFNVPTIDNDPTKDHWMAVRAIGANGFQSERTIAILHNGGLLNCTQQHDLALLEIASPKEGTIFGCGQKSLPVKVVVKNNGLALENNVQLAYQVNGEQPVIETFPGQILPGETKTFVFSEKMDLSGASDILLQAYANLPSDVASFNDHASINLNLALFDGNGESLSYSETFNGMVFPPPFYAIENPDLDVTWTSRQVIGSDGQFTHSMFMNNYAYSEVGQEDAFLVVPIDLVAANNPVLQFDLAYAAYNLTYSDGLRVELSTDCGQTFSQIIFEKHGEELSTAENHNQLFLPATPSEWRKESINLSAYIGHSVVLKFINVTGYGNSLFIDNIKVFEAVLPTANFTVTATQICKGSSVVFTSQSLGQELNYHWHFGQNAIPGNANGKGPIEVLFPDAGIYTIVLTVNNTAGASSFSQIIKVKEPPVVNFDYSTNNNQVVFNNQSLYANSYLWAFGDGTTSNAFSPLHSYTSHGVFTVNLTAINICGEFQKEAEVNVSVSYLNEPSQIIQAGVSPNPAVDQVTLSLDLKQLIPFSIAVKDLRGVTLMHQSIYPTTTQPVFNIDVGEYQGGIYLMEIKSEKEIKIFKFVVAQ